MKNANTYQSEVSKHHLQQMYHQLPEISIPKRVATLLGTQKQNRRMHKAHPSI
jgi:hypothetical protein